MGKRNPFLEERVPLPHTPTLPKKLYWLRSWIYSDCAYCKIQLNKNSTVQICTMLLLFSIIFRITNYIYKAFKSRHDPNKSRSGTTIVSC